MGAATRESTAAAVGVLTGLPRPASDLGDQLLTAARALGGSTQLQNVLADLSAGRIDAAVVDGSLSAYALKQNPTLRFELVADYVPDEKSSANCAFGVAKGNDGFLKTFNATYAAMKADGTAAKIFEKWGLTPTEFFLNP